MSDLLTSGRPEKNDTKFKKYDLDDEVDATDLLRRIAKGASVVESAAPAKKYLPLFKHPLPVSKHRYDHEANLKRIMSNHIERQAAAAVTLGDAYALEEVYMRGAPVEMTETNGFTPLHIAAQTNQIDCVMVLLNIGVNVNATNIAGVTPLFVARAAGSTQVMELLLEKGARINVDKDKFVHSSTVVSSSHLFKPNEDFRGDRAGIKAIHKSRRPNEFQLNHTSY
jgi:Ankyrin repeats (3 copies)